ncbi:MAG: hypothetical protein JSV49_12570 [Thermoplasmata archaeon]|nr:MAG: hypothetical protein JSV49_12570 [Thermoplasmata archaeon]
MDDLLLFSEILLMGICIVLLILNIYTYRLTSNKKVLMISVIFIILFLQALLALLSEFHSSLEFIQEPRVFMLVDVLVVLVIYTATVKA